MTVSSSLAVSGPYFGNGVTVAFPFSFEAETVEEVAVWVDETLTTAGFTVTLAGTGGTVTFDTAPAADVEIVIVSDPSFLQDIDLATNGRFSAAEFDEAHDRSAIRDIILKARLDGIAPPGAEVPGSGAGYFLARDAEGAPVFASGTGNDPDLRTDLAASSGAGLVAYLAAATGAVARSLADWFTDQPSLMDFIPLVERVKIRLGTSTADLSAYFQLALTRALAGPRGGEIYIPPGVYVMDMDCHAAASDFEKHIRIRGAGRGATQIRPTAPTDLGDPVATAANMLNIMGRNNLTVQDLTFYAGDTYQAKCAVFASRSTASGDCNNNKVLNCDFYGNYAAHAVIWCGAECSLFFNSRIFLTGGSGSAFWTGSDPSLCGVTPPSGTPLTGPCSANLALACETYALLADARHLTFSKSVGWRVLGHRFIGGNNNGQRFATFKDLDGGIFNGPVQIRDYHMEVFGTGNVGVYFDRGATTGATTWNEVEITGGHAVIDNNFVMVDFDRTVIPTSSPSFVHFRLTSPAIPNTITSGLPVYAYNLIDSHVDWRLYGGTGVVVVLGTATRARLEAATPRIASLSNSITPIYASTAPVAGTFARSQRTSRIYAGAAALGDATDWLMTVDGTYATMTGRNASGASSGNSVTVTVSPADLNVGEEVQIVDGATFTYRIAAIAGSTLYFTANLGHTFSAKAMSYFPGGSAAGYWQPIGILGELQCAAQADFAGADLAAVKVELNAFLAKLRTSNLVDT